MSKTTDTEDPSEIDNMFCRWKQTIKQKNLPDFDIKDLIGQDSNKVSRQFAAEYAQDSYLVAFAQ